MGKTATISTVDEQEIAEARGTTVPDMLYDVVARVATTSIGQFVYKRIDNLLWTVEKTARWSLPQPSPIGIATKTSSSSSSAAAAADESISGPPLIRPLPWLLFLPALIMLRMVRSGLSLGARFIGRGPVLPSSMVGFLQNKRRKLRALKYRGQRLQRIAKIEQEVDPKQVTWLQRIILPLRMVICTRPYRTIDANSDVAHAVIFRKDRPSASAGQKRQESKKRNLNQREAESADEEASDEYSFEDAGGCKELLDKYADEEDSSFNVEDASSSSSDTSLSDADPSPKKPTLETSRDQQQESSQPKQNGGQQPPATTKPDTLKRSSSENKNGVDSQSVPKPTSAPKTINAANRSKSAADLENGNTQSSAVAGPDGKYASTTSTTTPSKSIPNLSSSPENNENKPINQNISGGPAAAAAAAAAAAQIKSPSPTVLKSSSATTKQSPNMSEVRSNFQQQKQSSQKQLATSGSSTTNQQTSQQASQQQQQQSQYVSNGAKSRNKKGPTQSIA